MILILKLFIKEEKLLFFITNLRAFCIHFLQIFPSESAGNTLRFRGKKQHIFQTKFFPSVCPRYALGMPSVCPHLTTVYTTSSLLITFRRVKGAYLSSLLNSFYCKSEPTRTITDAKDSLEHPNNFGLKSDYPTVERE